MTEGSKRLLDWAVELQSLAQAGLAYGRDVYDIERFQRIREISAEMMAHLSDLPVEKVRDLFCNESGYQTPKLDTRAAIFEDDKILLVRENDGSWSLPGGWVDVQVSVKENTVKEVREEAGLEVRAERIIAVQDWAKRNPQASPYASPYGVCKIFVLCTALGGQFRPNIETTQSGYFPLDGLPPLAVGKNTAEQIAMCFEARSASHWETVFD